MRQTPDAALRIKRSGARAVEGLDGKLVVNTNDDTQSAEDMALSYRELQRVVYA